MRIRHTFDSKPKLGEIGTELTRLSAFYRPMDRLLSEADFEFLAMQPEMSARTIRKLRADRRRIFREYLRSLAVDFAFVTARIREIMVQSPQSRDDLAISLLRTRAVFLAAMFAIDCRLMLHACGFSRVRISAGSLTDALSRMQQDLSHLAPAMA